MKTIEIVVLMAILSIAAFGCTQQQTTPDQMLPKDDSMQKDSVESDGMLSMGDGYELKDGKMVIIKEKTHEIVPMQNDVTLKDGTILSMSGKVMRSDGTSFTLKEGESMWMDGSFMEAGAMMEESADKNEMMEDNAVGKIDQENEPQLLAGSLSRYYRYDEAHYKQSLADGKIIFLDFHADWCPICQNERPGILQAFNELANSNIVGYEVHFNDKFTTDEDEAAIRAHQVTLQHTKLFIKDGVVALKSLEKLTKQDILKKIEEIQNGQ